MCTSLPCDDDVILTDNNADLMLWWKFKQKSQSRLLSWSSTLMQASKNKCMISNLYSIFVWPLRVFCLCDISVSLTSPFYNNDALNSGSSCISDVFRNKLFANLLSQLTRHTFCLHNKAHDWRDIYTRQNKEITV